MSKNRTVKSHRKSPTRPIKVATKSEQHKAIYDFLTEEMPHEWELPSMPATPGNLTDGLLVGNWQKNTLISAAFISPPKREADELLIRSPLEHDAYTWMNTRLMVVHHIHTRANKRRQNAALDTLTFIRSLAVKHSQRYIIAAASNPAAVRLFRKAGYKLYPPGVSLTLQREGRSFGDFGGAFDISYAVHELGQRDKFTITANPPT